MKYLASAPSSMLSTFTTLNLMNRLVYTLRSGNGDKNVKVGNYPIVNAYANVHIKHTRFFVMMSHLNAGQGDKNYFFTPHYPMNQRVFRMGVSWNFFN